VFTALGLRVTAECHSAIVTANAFSNKTKAAQLGGGFVILRTIECLLVKPIGHGAVAKQVIQA